MEYLKGLFLDQFSLSFLYDLEIEHLLMDSFLHVYTINKVISWFKYIRNS